MTLEDKIQQLESALHTIKQLMPEVEAQISQMRGVAVARWEEKQEERRRHELKLEVRKKFYNNLKITK